MNQILAIDPGNTASAFVLLDPSCKPLQYGKIDNDKMLSVIESVIAINPLSAVDVAIEMVASYGMAVGKTVFDTCVWIGRFEQAARYYGANSVNKVYRADEKMNLCHSMKANDSTIRQALVDRFAPDTPNKGKGNKKNPGFFYGFRDDIWQAMAVGVTYLDGKAN